MIRKIDSNKFSLTILKVTTFSRIRQFKGVIGRVARWQGQQRVGVVVDELVTVVTAYIPSAFLMSI
ncbi:hypothetical protein F7D93_17080 [Prevotella copri]|nr:hypothetical protein [Segatella copri]